MRIPNHIEFRIQKCFVFGFSGIWGSESGQAEIERIHNTRSDHHEGVHTLRQRVSLRSLQRINLPLLRLVADPTSFV